MKKLLYFLLLVALIAVIFILIINVYIQDSSKGRIYSNVTKIPKRDVALLLGTAKYIKKGKINYFYKYRIDAATKLYKSGKVKAILVSGDNATKYYNEPATMRADLIKRGIPKNKIYLDFAGFRTLDSIMRAKEIFNLNSFTVVSQRFHIERAIYIARENNIDAIGFVAKDIPNTKAYFKVLLREYLARFKAFLDLKILHTTPKFFGKFEKIHIRENEE